MEDCPICLNNILQSEGFVSCPNSYKYHVRCFQIAYKTNSSKGYSFRCSCAYSFLESNNIMNQLNAYTHYQIKSLEEEIFILRLKMKFLERVIRFFITLSFFCVIISAAVIIKLAFFYFFRDFLRLFVLDGGRSFFSDSIHSTISSSS